LKQGKAAWVNAAKVSVWWIVDAVFAWSLVVCFVVLHAVLTLGNWFRGVRGFLTVAHAQQIFTSLISRISTKINLIKVYLEDCNFRRSSLWQ